MALFFIFYFFIFSVAHSMWLNNTHMEITVRIVSVSELKESTFVIPRAHLVMDGFLVLRHTDNRFLLRR